MIENSEARAFEFHLFSYFEFDLSFLLLSTWYAVVSSLHLADLLVLLLIFYSCSYYCNSICQYTHTCSSMYHFLHEKMTGALAAVVRRLRIITCREHLESAM